MFFSGELKPKLQSDKRQAGIISSIIIRSCQTTVMILFLQELVESPKRGTEGIGEVRFFKTLISVFGFEWNYTEGARVLRGWRVRHEGGWGGRARG